MTPVILESMLGKARKEGEEKEVSSMEWMPLASSILLEIIVLSGHESVSATLTFRVVY